MWHLAFIHLTQLAWREGHARAEAIVRSHHQRKTVLGPRKISRGLSNVTKSLTKSSL